MKFKIRTLFFFFLLLSVHQASSQSAPGSGSQTGSSKEEIILPVIWMDFYAKEQNNNIQLTWTTETDQGATTYEVEYSKDGGYNWEMLTQFTSDLGGVQDYSWTHYRPGPGTHYYRIRSREPAGLEYCSRIALVKISGDAIRFYPNPVTNGMLYMYLPEKSSVNIYGLNGRLISSGQYVAGQHTLNLSHLQEGAYWLQANGIAFMLRINK